MHDDDTRTRVTLPVESPVKAGWLTVDHRTVWAGVFLALGLGGLLLSFMGGAPLWGSMWVVLLAVVYAVVVLPPGANKESLLTKGGRQGAVRFYDAAGWNQATSNRAGAGEGFDADRRPFDPVALQRPKILGKLAITPYKVDGDDEPLGVMEDTLYDSLTGTFLVRGHSLMSRSTAAQDRALGAYGALVDLFNPRTSKASRFQYRTHTIPREEVSEDLLKQVLGTNPRLAADAFVAEVLADLSARSCEHLTTMSVMVHGPAIKAHAKRLGSEHAVLVEELVRLKTQLDDPNLHCTMAQPLSYNQLVGLNRQLIDPVHVETRAPELMRQVPGNPLLDPELAWPGYYDFKEGEICRTGSTWHQYFYVTAPDRMPVSVEDFALIQGVAVPKTVTTVIQPLTRREAITRARREANASRSAVEDRKNDGKAVSAEANVQAEETKRVETQAVLTTATSLRARIFVDICGTSPDNCKANASVFAMALQLTNLVMEPLTEQQALGLGATLPTGRGLEDRMFGGWV